MTELVFSNSAYAGIKQAQGMGKNYCGGAFAVGFVNKELSAEQLKELSEKVKSEEEERCRNAVPLPRNEVCWIDPVLSFGKINNADFWDMRAKVYRELYYEPSAEDLAERNIIESKKILQSLLNAMTGSAYGLIIRLTACVPCFLPHIY